MLAKNQPNYIDLLQMYVIYKGILNRFEKFVKVATQIMLLLQSIKKSKLILVLLSNLYIIGYGNYKYYKKLIVQIFIFYIVTINVLKEVVQMNCIIVMILVVQIQNLTTHISWEYAILHYYVKTN